MPITTAANAAAESAALYYRQGRSDKVYQASIEPAGPGYVVHFAYGRRGSTLTTGTKTPSPVAFDAAKKTFDKLVAEKRAKGYTPVGAKRITPSAGTSDSRARSRSRSGVPRRSTQADSIRSKATKLSPRASPSSNHCWLPRVRAVVSIGTGKAMTQPVRLIPVTVSARTSTQKRALATQLDPTGGNQIPRNRGIFRDFREKRRQRRRCLPPISGHCRRLP